MDRRKRGLGLEVHKRSHPLNSGLSASTGKQGTEGEISATHCPTVGSVPKVFLSSSPAGEALLVEPPPPPIPNLKCSLPSWAEQRCIFSLWVRTVSLPERDTRYSPAMMEVCVAHGRAWGPWALSHTLNPNLVWLLPAATQAQLVFPSLLGLQPPPQCHLKFGRLFCILKLSEG